MPLGTSERAIDAALRAHAPWLARQLDTELTRVLDPPQLTEREGRGLAHRLVRETIAVEEPRIGVRCRRVSIRDTRSRFGSCSSQGSLSFSWRLALAPRRILDYVVVHELCHLVHLDHSRRFWSLVERVRPDFREHAIGSATTAGSCLRIVRRMTRWATFDCYGTLIDWHGGIRAELARLWPDEDADRQLRRYHELEPEVEHEEPGLSYRQVMQRVLARLGDVPPGEEDTLGRALPGWSVFPEVREALERAREHGWRLAILSNTDRGFIEASKAAIGVPFDETVVASEIGSYKPATKHWGRTRSAPAPTTHDTCTSRRACSTTSSRRTPRPAVGLDQPARRALRHCADARAAGPRRPAGGAR